MSRKTILDPLDQLQVEHLQRAKEAVASFAEGVKMENGENKSSIEVEQRRKKKNKTS